jgi:hypothetical protein
VQRTVGILRHFRAFSTPKRNPALEVLSTPVPPPLTPTVSHFNKSIKKIYPLPAFKNKNSRALLVSIINLTSQAAYFPIITLNASASNFPLAISDQSGLGQKSRRLIKMKSSRLSRMDAIFFFESGIN